jgi:hypothetical protein
LAFLFLFGFLVISFSVMLLSKPGSSVSLPITYQSCDRISAHWLMHNMELDTVSGADEVSWDVMVAGQQLSPTVWSWLNMWGTVAVVQTVPVVSLFLGYCVPIFLFFSFIFHSLFPDMFWIWYPYCWSSLSSIQVELYCKYGEVLNIYEDV